MTSHWLDETFELEGRLKYDSLISDFLTSDFWVNFCTSVDSIKVMAFCKFMGVMHSLYNHHPMY